jgi:hypothetical protein
MAGWADNAGGGGDWTVGGGKGESRPANAVTWRM